MCNHLDSGRVGDSCAATSSNFACSALCCSRWASSASSRRAFIVSMSWYWVAIDFPFPSKCCTWCWSWLFSKHTHSKYTNWRQFPPKKVLSTLHMMSQKAKTAQASVHGFEIYCEHKYRQGQKGSQQMIQMWQNRFVQWNLQAATVLLLSYQQTIAVAYLH